MTKHTIGLAVLSASLALASAAQADVRTGRGSVAPIAPMITSASIDNGQRLLTIKGRYFGRDMPSVVLGDITLRVQQSADNQILAELPTGMKKASYRLTVAAGSALRINSDPFFATLLADVD